MISGHGDDSYSFRQNLLADFSSNAWYGGTPPQLLDHLRKRMDLITHYPEPEASTLCDQIAKHHGVTSNQVSAYNGSVEAFYTIAMAYRESKSAILSPGFAEYEDACHMHDHQLTFFTHQELANRPSDKYDLIWFGNPNNPDGKILTLSEIRSKLENCPNTLFIVDEAYADFIDCFQSAIELTNLYSNLIVVRSMTKCYAIPGLRLGYIVTSTTIADRLQRFRQPWSVNALAQEAGIFLMGQPNSLFCTNDILCRSIHLQRRIDQIEGFRVIPSTASFFLTEMRSGTAAELKQFLLDHHRLLIRDASNFRGLNKHFFRISIQTEENNQLLINGLHDWNLKHIQ